MADIKQAAKWMKEGKRVKRTGWKPISEEISLYLQQGASICEGPYGLIHASGVMLPIWVSVNSLLADDWEIAE